MLFLTAVSPGGGRRLGASDSEEGGGWGPQTALRSLCNWDLLAVESFNKLLGHHPPRQRQSQQLQQAAVQGAEQRA